MCGVLTFYLSFSL